MALDELADGLTAARFMTAERGYSPEEVDELLARAATALRLARDGDDLLAVADRLETARFTPVPNGYEPFAVRGVLARAIADVRDAANGAPHLEVVPPLASAPAREAAPSIEFLGLDAELKRLEAYEHELADRLARLAPQAEGAPSDATAESLRAELIRLREEIRVAGTTLRDLVRQVSLLRRKAREEITRELADIEARWLGGLADQVAERLRRGPGGGPADHGDG